MNMTIVAREIKKGTKFTDIAKMANSTKWQIRYIYTDYPNYVTDNLDHIIYLKLSYMSYKKLVRDKLTSIQKIKDMLNNNRFDFLLKYPENVQDEILDKIIKFEQPKIPKKDYKSFSSANKIQKKKQIPSAINIIPQETIKPKVFTAEELSYCLLNDIYDVLENKNIPKAYLSESVSNSPNGENIFVGETFILINSSWLKERFDQHCKMLKYELIGYNHINSYFQISMDFLNRTTSIFYQKSIGARKYSYNRYPVLTGTTDSYLKLYIDKFEQFTNKFIRINKPVDDIYEMDDAPNIATQDIVENTTYCNNTCNYNIIITNCKNTFGVITATYLAVDHEKINNFEFNSKLIQGVYTFTPDHIEQGILSYSPLGNVEEEQFKRKIIAVLTNMNNEGMIL